MGITKMTNTKLGISWRDFEVNAPQTFRQLWNDQDFADITLATEDGQQIRAHKDIKYGHLKSIIEYIYTGKCEVKQTEMIEFMSAGKVLGVIGLIEEVEKKDVNTPVENFNTNCEQVQCKENIKIKPEKGLEFIGIDREMSDISQRGNNSLICDDCGVVYRSNLGLTRHIESVHELVRYECNHCEYKANHKSGLRYHINMTHQGVQYRCDSCFTNFTSQSDLTLHIQSTHKRVRKIRYECDQCDYKVASKSGLIYHLKGYHQEGQYSCDKCDHIATSKSNLTQHVKIVHQVVKYNCDECDFIFTSSCSVTRHIQSVHNKIRRHECNQ